jgi:hypothetical protein
MYIEKDREREIQEVERQKGGRELSSSKRINVEQGLDPPPPHQSVEMVRCHVRSNIV